MRNEHQPEVSFLPTDGLSYDPTDPHYYDPKALDKELTRAFALCHSCRMCFKYCDVFPLMFSLIDEKYDGNVRAFDERDRRRVLDACFQCKLCEVQCPYTPRDKHEFQLDFPSLVHRYAAVQAKTRGLTLQQRILGNPDLTAVAARASLGMANIANDIKPARHVLQLLTGIHHRKLLPKFAFTPFDQWAQKHGRMREEPGGEAVLFQTCFVQHNDPDLGRDVLDVLDRNKVDVSCVRGLQCCGMPAWEHGDLAGLRRQAHANLELLMPFVEKGAKVLVVNPTCSMVMRREYPHLLEGADRDRAKVLAQAVMDPSEYLWSIRNEPRFNTDFRSSPGDKVAYHAPCHLRAQAIGFKGRDLLRKIPGVKPVTVMECCGHDGTYAMTVQGFDVSQRVGKKAFDGMREVGAEVWATDCPLAALQFQQHAGVKPLHPMSILARAYRTDGFPHPVVKEGDTP